MKPLVTRTSPITESRQWKPYPHAGKFEGLPHARFELLSRDGRHESSSPQTETYHIGNVDANGVTEFTVTFSDFDEKWLSRDITIVCRKWGKEFSLTYTFHDDVKFFPLHTGVWECSLIQTGEKEFLFTCCVVFRNGDVHFTEFVFTPKGVSVSPTRIPELPRHEWELENPALAKQQQAEFDAV